MGAIQDLFRRYAPDYLKRFAEGVSAEQRKVIAGHWRVPHRGARLGVLSVRGLRPPAHRARRLRQPPLPAVPAPLAHTCGSRASSSANYRDRTSCSLSPCPKPCGHFSTAISAWAMGRCSRPPLSPSRLWCEIHASSGGDEAGFFGVLHTWGRQLQYHPHSHYVVPGGALSSEDGVWHAASSRLLPARARALENLPRQVPRPHAARRAARRDSR